MPPQLVEQGWPDFPSNADLFVRTWGQESGSQAYVGFASDRVGGLQVRLEDGSVLEIPLLSFPNPHDVSTFILFPPTVSLGGTFVALDPGGAVLATASTCAPDDRVQGCSVLATEQLAPGPAER